jgi:hypothetical protein
MKTIIEYLIIGLVSSICCILSHSVIYSNHKKNYSYVDYLKYSKTRNNIIMCFFVGVLIHYIIKTSDITSMYCKKVCYDDKCFIVCPI